MAEKKPVKPMVFNRTNNGHLIKFQECLKLLEYSMLMVRFFHVREFNNVIAVQLRMLLNDKSSGKENSLYRKINPDPKLFPVSNKLYMSEDGIHAFFPLGEMFDYSGPMIDLDAWLNQTVFKMQFSGEMQEVAIKDVIRFYANKSGGAHVDSTLAAKPFLIDVQGEFMLSDIAEGFLRSLGRDWQDASVEHLSYILKRLNEESGASNQ